MNNDEQTSMDGSPALVESEDGFIRIKFQAGPVPDGRNGTGIEDVIQVLIDRLKGFQRGPFACNENAHALQYLREARWWLDARTKRRQEQGVEGTMAPHR